MYNSTYQRIIRMTSYEIMFRIQMRLKRNQEIITLIEQEIIKDY